MITTKVTGNTSCVNDTVKTSLTPATSTNNASNTSQSRTKVNFTHEADIEVDGVDLEKIFESESDTDDDYKDIAKDAPLNTLVIYSL